MNDLENMNDLEKQFFEESKQTIQEKPKKEEIVKEEVKKEETKIEKKEVKKDAK